MSTQDQVCYDCLSPYTREPGSGGPTNTFTLQKTFAQRLRGALSRINSKIRSGIVENDVFGLRSEENDTLQVDDIDPFQTDENPTKIAGFITWLRRQLNTEFLTVVGPDRNQFIRAAYLNGLRKTNSQLRDLDVAFTPENADDVIGRPIHLRALQTLYTRTYENLQSVANDVVSDVRDTLVQGFSEGQSPTKIARDLTDRVDSIGKNRATMIARSEVINAHSESTLTRIDEVQEETPDDEVLATTHGDWDAANDTRTCPFCRAMDGVRLSTNEMRGTIVGFRGSTYRLKPPAHVNGRCNIGIRVGGELTESLEDRLPAEVTLING